MKVTLEPTGQIDVVNGAQARVWIGEDDTGTPVKAWVATISPQTHDEAANQRFAEALREVKASLRATMFDTRLIT